MSPNESEGSSMLKSKNIKWRNTRVPFILYSWLKVTLLFNSSFHYSIIQSVHSYYMQNIVNLVDYTIIQYSLYITKYIFNIFIVQHMDSSNKHQITAQKKQKMLLVLGISIWCLEPCTVFTVCIYVITREGQDHLNYKLLVLVLCMILF